MIPAPSQFLFFGPCLITTALSLKKVIPFFKWSGSKSRSQVRHAVAARRHRNMKCMYVVARYYEISFFHISTNTIHISILFFGTIEAVRWQLTIVALYTKARRDFMKRRLMMLDIGCRPSRKYTLSRFTCTLFLRFIHFDKLANRSEFKTKELTDTVIATPCVATRTSERAVS